MQAGKHIQCKKKGRYYSQKNLAVVEKLSLALTHTGQRPMDTC